MFFYCCFFMQNLQEGCIENGNTHTPHAHLKGLCTDNCFTLKHRRDEGQIHNPDGGSDGDLVLSAQRSEEKVSAEDSQAGNWFIPAHLFPPFS